MIFKKTPEEIEKMKVSNQIVAKIIEEIKAIISPGMNTLELDIFAEKSVLEKGALPAFKGYKGYSYSLCTSINNEVVHGIPSKKKILKNGDILSIDFGVLYDGYYGDSAVTIPIGKISDKAKKIISITENALYKGIENAKSGNKLGDISFAIQQYVESYGYSVVRDFVGHGIGKNLHEDPQVPNFGYKNYGVELSAGMVIAIEPMVNEGSFEVTILNDHWTVVTLDGKLSAHFEHSIAITEYEPIILSKNL